MPLRARRSSADVRDEFYEAVRLLLFESGAETSMQASQYARNGRVPSATVSQSGKTRTGGYVSSAKISCTTFSVAGMKAHLTHSRRSALIGRSLFDKSDNRLR